MSKYIVRESKKENKTSAWKYFEKESWNRAECEVNKRRHNCRFSKRIAKVLNLRDAYVPLLDMLIKFILYGIWETIFETRKIVAIIKMLMMNNYVMTLIRMFTATFILVIADTLGVWRECVHKLCETQTTGASDARQQQILLLA